MNYILPCLILFVLLYSKHKKINVYKTFIDGSKESFKLIYNIFPYILTIMIAISLLKISGITGLIIDITAPIFNILGIPKEILELVLLKPFTGSGSIAILDDIMNIYGVDSYISKCAACIMGSSETIFYVSSVYFAETSVKKIGIVIPICLIATLIGSIFSCLLCKII